jgi:radical SAM protein with 4Fe4S-binding SPASM domain
VATRINVTHLRETIELAFALGADGVMLNRFNPGGRGFRNLDILQPSPAQLWEALDVANELSQEYELPISCSIAMPPCLFDHSRWPNLSFGFCAAGTDRAYYTIDSTGNLRPCNHSSTILGDLSHSGFWELIDSQEMNDFVSARPSFCSDCRVVDTCLGGCKAAGQVCYGRPEELIPLLRTYRHLTKKP